MNAKKFWVRMMAALLVLLMLLSAAAMTIQLLTISAGASDFTGIKTYYTPDGKDILMAVGLMYADGVTVGFETRAKNGFIAGALDADRRFTPLYTIGSDCVSITCDTNLGKKGMTYYILSQNTDTGAPAAGGWHIETPADADASVLLSLYENLAQKYGYNIFRASVNGQTRIRAGQFSNRTEAEAAAALFNSEGVDASAAGPSATAVSVIDPYTDRILFEFDGGKETSLGLEPVQSGDETVYLVTPARNTYGGIFKYSRWKTDTADGVAVTNILPLEEYIEGVLPWEVGNGWAPELLRTFAVAIRSFALTSRKHVTFDLCNSTCCQAYRGRNRVNDAIIEAVVSTKGIVLTYENKTVCTYYSSSTGGTTVAAADAWGSTKKYPYLKAVVTPWEQIEPHPYDSWVIEYSPARLLAKLNEAGYTELSGSIKSVETVSLAENSSYVRSLKITDIKGTSVTINRTDAIRTQLGLNSANFVVGKSGENITVTDYNLEGIDDILKKLAEKVPEPVHPKNGVYVLSALNATAHLMPVGESIALTGELGMNISLEPDKLTVITENGLQAFDLIEADNLNFPDDHGNNDLPSVRLPNLSEAKIIQTQRTVTAGGDSGNFVFIGRGWGHGVGLSQYGAKALADLGCNYETILTTYFPGTKLMDYRTVLSE